jgi:hypothetical protein
MTISLFVPRQPQPTHMQTVPQEGGCVEGRIQKTERWDFLQKPRHAKTNYRILTPCHHALPVLPGEKFPDSNYPFSTPRTKDAEIRIQVSKF